MFVASIYGLQVNQFFCFKYKFICNFTNNTQILRKILILMEKTTTTLYEGTECSFHTIFILQLAFFCNSCIDFREFKGEFTISYI